MRTPIVQLRHLGKHYGTLRALEDVSLDIYRGEIFALLGPNGAGKTTLIGIVSGLVRRGSGEAIVDGHDVTSDYLVTRRAIGLVPQEINYDPFFTVEEILRIQAGYFGVKLTEERLLELLQALGLSDKRRANTRSLSGGMKRRLLIGKALVHDPKVLFLDEPTAGVDVELRRDLWNYVRRLREGGTTIVLTTHYLEEAEELADRVGVIDHGRLLLVEDKARLLERMGSRILTIELQEPAAELPARLAQLGGGLSEDRMRITFTTRASEAVGERLEAAVEAGLRVKDVDVRQSRLEDVFMRLVGGER